MSYKSTSLGSGSGASSTGSSSNTPPLLPQYGASHAKLPITTVQKMLADPKYKKYAQQVEKCLNTFDNVHEWADCISFLKQLLKTFQSYMQFKEIPNKVIVAKRLAQCLNPALPTGVHQRALEVYAHILAVSGSEGLRDNLGLWSSGLFPFFEYAATSVKPTLLNLYDTHYLPLAEHLRPATKSFIIALLPGLEEETGEFFDKVLALLDRVSGSVTPAFFFQNIWLTMLTKPSSRETALTFLARRLPALNAEDDIASIVGRDTGLMIRAFSAALEDDNLLVRRGALDLLLSSLPINSVALKKAQRDDRVILMRAASCVVLRRDLTLNRRLYKWLLGADERSEQQISYFKEHGLELLRSTLKDEMFTPSGDYAESRPFKVFISLLDRWEIGATLTEHIALDSFVAIQKLVSLNNASKEEIILTGGSLYEAIEPPILWKLLSSAVFAEIVETGSDCKVIQLLTFILKMFSSSHDEEVRTIHLPVIFCAIQDLLHSRLASELELASHHLTKEVLALQQEILLHIPAAALLQRPELTAAVQQQSLSQSSYPFAITFYGIPIEIKESSTSAVAARPIASVLEHVITLSAVVSQKLRHSPTESLPTETLSRTLAVLADLVEKVQGDVSLSWHPSKWLTGLLACLEHESIPFALVDLLLSLVLKMHRCTYLQPALSIDHRPIMRNMVNRLLHYLGPTTVPYHVRSVNLIWELQAATTQPHVEAILCQNMNNPKHRNVEEAYEAFGVLWRLSEDAHLPGTRFHIPMMIVLDTLKSEDPALRRVGETWMRCSLRSYTRILDPILYHLVDPSIRTLPTVSKIHVRELPGFLYETTFDQRYIHHLLETLGSVAKFGGLGFAKTIQTNLIRNSFHTGLIRRAEEAGVAGKDTTYLDVLSDLLARFVQGEPKPGDTLVMEPVNILIQSSAIDLLQTIVSRGEIDLLTVQTVEAVTIAKLYYSVHHQRLDLQNKLLHLLHSLISASISLNPALHGKASDQPLDPELLAAQNGLGGRAYPLNPLLIQTLIDGISAPSNRPILQHWLDFVLMAIPQFQPTLQSVVLPLNDCLGKQVLLTLYDLQRVSTTVSKISEQVSPTDVISTTSDAEFIMLLNGLERLILLNLASSWDYSSSGEEDGMMSEKIVPETGGLLGYMSNVFSSEPGQSSEEQQFTVRSPGYRSLHDGMRILFLAWATTPYHKPANRSSCDDTISLTMSRTRLRCRRVIENLFRVHSAEVLESIIDFWNRESLDPSLRYDNDTAFELVDSLIANAAHVVHMICESISYRAANISDKGKKQVLNPELSDLGLFKFLEAYLQRLEGPLALQVWPRFMSLAKEFASSAKDSRPQTFPTLRCLSMLALKVPSNALDDKRMRKDLQEIYGRLLDGCVAFVGRSADPVSWIRRSAKEALTSGGRDSPAPRQDTLDEKMEGSTASLAEASPKMDGPSDAVYQINQFIASDVLPSVRRYLVDSDKVLSACTNIVYYIVNPAIKTKSRPLNLDEKIIDIMRELSRIPAALKAWKPPISEVLSDNRLFNASSESALKWKPIIKSYFDADKTAFSELLAKVITTPSTNIFTNKEYEHLLRSLNLRRISLVVLTAEKNHFLTHLPSIQEKLVDVLRNVSAPIVQSEVYLCIRVLLCRLSPHNLTSFWPVILTELYRVFDQLRTSMPSDGSDDLQLVLAASKCLDLLITLQTDEFQIYQWMFITDTVDAVYRPDQWSPNAMLDQLAEIAANLPSAPSIQNGEATPGTNPSYLSHQRLMRRPSLNHLRQIDSLRDLVPFFSNISVTSYESVYSSHGSIDWAAVEKGLLEDIFDPRS